MKLQQRPRAKATYRLRPIIGYSIAVLVMGIGTLTYLNLGNSQLSSAFTGIHSSLVEDSPNSNYRSALLDSISPGGLSIDSIYPVIWLDAADKSSVTLSGNEVLTWTDKSGTIGDLTVKKGTPVYAGSINSHSVINFTNDEMEGGDAFNGSVTEMHTFYVCKENTASENRIVSFNGMKSGNSNTPSANSKFSFVAPEMSSNRWCFDAGNAKTNGERCYTDIDLTSPGDVTLVSAFKSVTEGHNGISLNGGPTYTSATAQQAFTQDGLLLGRKTSDHDFAEIIAYDFKLSSFNAKKVESYLGLKYGITLTHDYICAGGTILWDTTANTGFNKNIAGLGIDPNSGLSLLRSQSNNTDSRILVLADSSEVQAGEFLLWGTNGDQMGSFGIHDFPAESEGRIGREWKFNSTGNVGAVDLQFDLSNMGIVNASDIQLLIDINNDGLFYDESVTAGGIRDGAVDMGSNIYAFNNITLNGNVRISIGTSNKSTNPLPIDLLQFDAALVFDQVDLTWTTASEIDNDFFTIERTVDMINWTMIDKIKGAGNSTSILEYSAYDDDPLKGISYYRLKQTDYNGDFTYSTTRTIKNNSEEKKAELKMYPNPATDFTHIELGEGDLSNYDIMIINMAGQVQRSNRIPFNTSSYRVDLNGLKTGTYIIMIQKGDIKLQKRIIVEQY